MRHILVSHKLCPYVQRVAIVLAEKRLPFERIDIDLAEKPDWFLRISPLGKTPVLLVDGEAIFESAAICEYLDECTAPALHPEDALRRARDRGWMEFGSSMLNAIGAFYSAASESAMLGRAEEIRRKFQQMEAALVSGPYFHGQHFSMVDVVFGPVFRYLDVFDDIGDFGLLAQMPKVCAWRMALRERASIRDAALPDYRIALRDFLLARGSALSTRIAAAM